jgi:hypothetical protein
LATNALRDWGAEIRSGGTVSTAYPDARMTPIHIDDVARVAAALLSSPTFRGRFQILTGPRSMTLRDMIGTIADVRGQPIDLIELAPEQATRQRPEWLPADVFGALLDASAAATGIQAPINNTVERLRRVPRTLDLDFRDGGLDPLQIARRQFDSIGSDVFLETMHLGRAWDRGRSTVSVPAATRGRSAREMHPWLRRSRRAARSAQGSPAALLSEIATDYCVRRCPRTSSLR